MTRLITCLFLLLSTLSFRPLNAQCSLSNLELVTSDCDGNFFFVTLNFDYAGVGNDGFKVHGNGQNYGTFNYDDLPVTIGPLAGNGTTFYEFAVMDLAHPGCSTAAPLGTVSCSSGDCDIFELVVDPGDCLPDGSYNLWINFQHENAPNDFFEVFYAGQVIGFFPLNELPVMIPHFNDNGEPFPVIAVCINDTPDCCAEKEFEAPNCGGGDCLIYDMTAIASDCENGKFYVTIDFEYENTGSEGFKLQGSGINYGTFEYGDLPVTIGPLLGDGTTFYEFVAIDLEHPGCHDFVEFGTVDCSSSGGCHIFEIFAEAHPCDGNFFLLDIEFLHENTGSEGFTIKANGQVLGEFDYGQNFYTVGPLTGGVLYEIVIRDNQYPDCKGIYQFGPVSCGGGDCHIFDLVAEAGECDDEGQFYVTLDFEHSGTGNDGFKIFGNGNVYGFFNYDDLPVTIGPFQTPIDDLEFIAADVQHPDCHDFVELDAPDCNGGGGDCEIDGLSADVHPCLSNGTFYVTLDFEFANTSGYFKVQGNGVNYGIFSYDEVPVSIGPLVGDGTTNYGFVVRDLHFHDCAEDVTIGTVECVTSGDCEIVDLVADAGECHNDETYNIWVNFDFVNPTNNYYDLFHNGELVDYYPLSHIPAIIPHVAGNGEPMQTVTVCINDNPGCCATVEYEAPDCEGLVVWPGDANADHTSSHFDLLNIGLAFGAEGQARSVQGIEWTGLDAANWNQTFANQLNFKHADCNGDGKVTAADLEAIHVNFGETNGTVQPPVFIGGSENDPPFFVDLPAAGGLTPGSQFTAPILLGTEGKPVQNLYGIAFTLKFDPEIINPQSIQFQYDPSWLGVMNVNLLTFDKKTGAGTVQMALVRTDQNNVSGHGQIAAIIGIIDNIAGKEKVSIEIQDVRAIRENEVLVPLHRPVEVVDLVNATTEPGENDKLNIFPNPVNQTIFISHQDGLPVEAVEMSNMNGQQVLIETVRTNQLEISHLAPGVYTLKAKAGDRFYIKKVVKI